jgi:hypothetical protein
VLRLSGLIAAPDGSSVIRAQAAGPAGDGAAIGRQLAHRLLRDGAGALLGRTVRPVTPIPSPRQAASLSGRRAQQPDGGIPGHGAARTA